MHSRMLTNTHMPAILCSIILSATVYFYEKDISIRLAKASVYVYLSQAIQPSSSLMFYWSKESEDNCNGEYGSRPCFSPVFMSALDVVGYVFFIVGTACYNKYFSAWTYKKIWTYTQILLASIGKKTVAK